MNAYMDGYQDYWSYGYSNPHVPGTEPWHDYEDGYSDALFEDYENE